jgi:hypothetical protein
VCSPLSFSLCPRWDRMGAETSSIMETMPKQGPGSQPKRSLRLGHRRIPAPKGSFSVVVQGLRPRFWLLLVAAGQSAAGDDGTGTLSSALNAGEERMREAEPAQQRVSCRQQRHCSAPAALSRPLPSDDDALDDAPLDGFVSSIIQHGSANVSVIGQSLRLLQRRPIF